MPVFISKDFHLYFSGGTHGSERKQKATTVFLCTDNPLSSLRKIQKTNVHLFANAICSFVFLQRGKKATFCLKVKDKVLTMDSQHRD